MHRILRENTIWMDRETGWSSMIVFSANTVVNVVHPSIVTEEMPLLAKNGTHCVYPSLLSRKSTRWMCLSCGVFLWSSFPCSPFAPFQTEFRQQRQISPSLGEVPFLPVGDPFCCAHSLRLHCDDRMMWTILGPRFPFPLFGFFCCL